MLSGYFSRSLFNPSHGEGHAQTLLNRLPLRRINRLSRRHNLGIPKAARFPPPAEITALGCGAVTRLHGTEAE